MTDHADLTDDIQATLNRLEALVDTSHFEQEDERLAIKSQLNTLRLEISEGAEQELPADLEERLRQTEAIAIKRLIDTPPAHSETTADVDVSWEDMGKVIETAVTSWEARHPKLALSFMKLNDLLAKLGI